MNFHQAIEVLGLQDDFSVGELKRAYKKKALLHHPDKNPDDIQAALRFKLVGEAYRFLLRRPPSPKASPKKAKSPPARTKKSSPTKEVGDIFQDILGFEQRGGVLGAREPSLISLQLWESVQGGQKQASLPVLETCVVCQGSGSSTGVQTGLCRYCFGQGEIKTQGKVKYCPKCQGRGRPIKDPCSHCQGFGTIGRKKNLHFQLSSGLGDDDELRVMAADSKNNSHEINLKIELIPHRIFKKDGINLACEFPLSISQAQKGEPVLFPGLSGWVSLLLHPHTQQGEVFVLKKQGILGGGHGPGDLHVKIKLVSDQSAEKERKIFIHQATFDNPFYKKQTTGLIQSIFLTVKKIFNV